MYCKFLTPYDGNLDHKINRQKIHILVKYLSLQQQSIYHRASIVDETNRNQGDQDDFPFQPKKTKHLLIR